MNILTPSTSTNRPTSEHVLHPKAFQSWRWVFLAALLLATVAITTFYFSSAQAQGADGAIAGLTLTSTTAGTLTVSWDAASPTPTDYRVDWAKSGEDYQSWKVDEGHKYPDPSATTTTITDLSHDTEYKIRMRARYYRGEHEGKSWGGPWAEATITVAGEPAETPTPEPVQEEESTTEAGAIGTLTATDDDTGQLLLTWEAPAAPNATPTDYHVNWAKSSEDYPADTAPDGNDHPTDTTLTLTGLDFDTDYNIRVRARYTDGENAASPWNGPWTETTARVKLPLPMAINMTGAAVSPASQVFLFWSYPSNDSITGYQILRGPKADSLVVIEDDTGSTSTSYTDTAPPAGQTHTYAVKARNASGLSPLSNTLTATVPAAEAEEVLIVARHESSENTLVSNLGQTTTGAGGGIAGPSHGNHYEIATSFTTGTNTLGYHPTSVQLHMSKLVGGDTPTPQVSIRGDNAGVPGETALYTLNTSTEITTSYQLITFTTSDEVALQPNTKYWLYINATGGTVTAQQTTSDDEDIESNTDWRIGDDRVFKENGGTWTTATANSLRMQINGHTAPPVLVSNLDASPSGVLTLSFYQVNSTARTAQSFSAAHNADGSSAEFDFHAITVLLEGSGGQTASLAASDLLVTVHSDTSGQPGDLLYTLIPPVPLTVLGDGGPVTFTAPPSSTLSSGITYWLKLEAAAASTYFGGDFIFVQRAGDGSEVQGPTTDNRWTIGDSSLKSRQVLSWQTDNRVVKMSVLGLQLAAPLVSNLGQTIGSPAIASLNVTAAQAFVAGPGLSDFGYQFQGVRVSAYATLTLTDVAVPEVRASLHSDGSGIPGSRLHTLTVPDNFASTLAPTHYTLLAPPGTILRGGARYWVVFKVSYNGLFLETTTSTAEDQTPPPVYGWLIDNQRYAYDSELVWTSRARPIKLAVLGRPNWVSDEPDGVDFPGAGHNAHKTLGYVTPGIISNGHLTAGLDYDHGHSGDYWWLETQRGHRYRVEVKFGDNPNNDTGGSAWMSFIDPDHHDYPYASGCCEADHNRDDGHTFVHFYRPTDDWNNRYLINVAAFDKLNHNSRIYNGPYTITMTDITGTEKVATNLYLGTRIESTPLPEIDESVKYAVSFTTGDHSAGYKLDRVRIHVPDHEGQPNLVLHDDASGLPGDGICDLLEPNKVQHHRPYTADNALPVPFRAAHCGSEAFLDANTTYWLVLEGTDYETVFTDSSDQQTRGSGWTIGDRAATSIVGSWGNLASTWGTIPVEIWANKLNNPLSVSLEVTSDPTHGTDSDTYGAGDVITFEVKFTEAVTITGAPRLRFKISGTGDDYAPYLSGSGTNTLVFAYTVLATDADTNGIFLYNRPLSYPDADADTIVAVDDNLPVIDKITGQIRTLSGHKIDGTITN